MPLLDHFHPPLSETRKWEGFHSHWTSSLAALPLLKGGSIAWKGELRAAAQNLAGDLAEVRADAFADAVTAEAERRLTAFLDPKSSNQAAYNLRQSRIAVSSGGLTGKGLFKGTQTNLDYVPAQTVPNLVTVKVGPGGMVSVYNNAGSTHLVVDVAGWYSDGSPRKTGRYTPVAPTRLGSRFHSLAWRRAN